MFSSFLPKSLLMVRPSTVMKGLQLVSSQTVIAVPRILPLSITVEHPQQLTQLRYRWTKAKKKRYARYERRQELESKGIQIPKPGGYTPTDTPVVHAYNREERMKEIQEQDERASEELRNKLQAAAIAREHSVLRYHMTGITMNERVRKLLALHNGNQKEVVKAQKQLGMQIFQVREGDTGSSAVQIIALTTRIQQLQTHLTKHKKDKHSKRGMDALFVRRRKLLDYLEREDFDAYRKVVKTLGLSRS